jgi:hypothetical protein
MRMWQWFTTLISGRPHFYIGGKENPYMLRWYLIPRNRWFNVYLHKFLRDDDDRALHDHPWSFVSIVLSGEYYEWMPDTEAESHGLKNVIRRTRRAAGSIAFRSAEHRHMVQLPKRKSDGEPVPCWTLVFTGRKWREWGFWCPKGFVPWHEFVASDDHGNIGRGCD